MTRLRLFLTLFLVLVMAGPALAHKLKVFATVEGGDVTGYAFFVGGGRAQNSGWQATGAAGKVMATGTTSTEGVFRFTPPAPVTADITITVNTGEGHMASATVKAARFGAAEAAPAPAGNEAGTPTVAAPPAPAVDQIEAAVQRQVGPLLERIEEMDARIRFTDIMSGLFLIIGLAGIGLWARARRP
jgi:nickel transport protein